MKNFVHLNIINFSVSVHGDDVMVLKFTCVVQVTQGVGGGFPT